MKYSNDDKGVGGGGDFYVLVYTFLKSSIALAIAELQSMKFGTK